MMKKFFKQLVIVLVVSAIAAAPLAASAACPLVTTLRTFAEQHFTTRRDALAERHRVFVEKNTVSDARIAAAVAARRTQQDERLTETINRLKESDADAAAVATLEASVQAALQKERAAIDAAQTEFIAKRASALEAARAEAQSLLDDFRAELLVAFDTADAACASRGRLSAADRAALRQAYEAARARFAERRQALAAEAPLAAARKRRAVAIKAAHIAYRTELETAISAFKGTVSP